MRLIDLTGKRFGKLKVLKMLPERKSGEVQWLVQCDCGNQLAVVGNVLTRGQKSCNACKATTHGLTKHPLYYTWKGMIARCCNPNHKS